jgi:UbiD family decarboxylase
MVIMVDEDVDPFNLPQVMWALSSKVNPAGDLVHCRICRCWSLIRVPVRRDYRQVNY